MRVWVGTKGFFFDILWWLSVYHIFSRTLSYQSLVVADGREGGGD